MQGADCTLVRLFLFFVCLRCRWGIVPPLLLLEALWKINSTMSKAQAEQFAAIRAAKTNKARPAVTAAAATNKPSASPEKKKPTAK